MRLWKTMKLCLKIFKVFLLTMMLIVGDFYMFGDIIPVKRDTYLV